MPGLVLKRKKDERIIIGEGEGKIIITVVDIRHDGVRLHIDAPRHLRVDREEVYQRLQAESRPPVAEASTNEKPSMMRGLAGAIEPYGVPEVWPHQDDQPLQDKMRDEQERDNER